jgi:hypothetical protein
LQQQFLLEDQTRAREDQLLEDQKRSAAKAAVDDLEKTMRLRQLFDQPALSLIEDESITFSARHAAAGDFESQQRLDHVQQQIENQRREEQDRQTHREMQAWKEKSQSDWSSHP